MWLLAEFNSLHTVGQRLPQFPCPVDLHKEQLVTWHVLYPAEQVRKKGLEHASCSQNEELSSLVSRAMDWREQSLEKVRDLAVVCGQGISPGKTLSSYRAGCFVTQVPGYDGRERCQVGGGWHQYGFGHQTHLLIKAAVQPQTLNVAGNSGNNGVCISPE